MCCTYREAYQEGLAVGAVGFPYEVYHHQGGAAEVEDSLINTQEYARAAARRGPRGDRAGASQDS